MAIRTVTICDLCDKAGDDYEAEDSLNITVAGTAYHADLCADHATEMNKRVEAVVNFMVAGGVKAPTPKTKRPANVSYAEVKAWARGQGMSVNERGRPPQKTVEAFLASKKKK
jgi:hypothetical protein